MSADPTPDWRGVKQEIAEETDATVGLRAPSRRLLANLVRPHRRMLVLLIGIVILEAAARLVVPVLVRRVLDHALVGDDALGVLYPSLALMVFAIVVQVSGRVSFVRLSGRVGNKILLDLRRRLFKQFQRLSIGFHDKYTSGRAFRREPSSKVM